MNSKSYILIFCLVVSLVGCATGGQHLDSLKSSEEKKLTTGVVQKEIREGMSQAEVAQHLGSPNLVTRDKEGQETWIYEKMSTDYAYSNSSGGVGSLILGWGGSVGGGGFGSFSKNSGASSASQRTLTVIIKFKDGLVNELTYNASSF